MDSRLRTGLLVAGVIVYLIVAVLGALWLAGVFYFLLHKAAPHGVTLSTWLTYQHFYWHKSVERKDLLIAILVAGAIAAAPGFMALSVLGNNDRELHGSAKFASPGDVRKAGLMGTAGIIVGKYRGRFLQFPGQQFCLLAAPTRSGKGVSFVIPNLLNWPESCVVLDIKLENFLLTSKFRESHGQKVFLFNPFAEDFKSHRWNPLDGISRDPNFRVGDVMTLGSSLYPGHPGDKDAFWQDSAKNLFLGLTLMVMEIPEIPVTLGEVLRQSSGAGVGLKEYLAAKIAEQETKKTPLSSDCLGALHRFMSASDNTLANIISTFTAPLTLFANPIVDAATSASDFDIGAVRDQKMTIYIGIQPNRLADASLLINVLFGQLININTRELPSKEKHRLQCLLIMDEFTAIGKIGILAKANAYIAGFNLRLLTIVQSVAQLESVYGPADARTLITNHAMQVLFTPREQKDANAYSEMLGFYTVKSTSTGRSSTRGLGGGGSSSENISDQRRALMLPQELRELADTDQIIMFENTKPIHCEKARFFKEPAFIDRLKAVSKSLATLKGLPTKAELDKAAFADHELAVSVPIMKIDLQAARPQGKLRALRPGDKFNLTDLNVRPAELPQLDDPVKPSVESMNRMLGKYYIMAGVDTGSVLAEMRNVNDTKTELEKA
jgi:type IV secretion system protein VirD4